MGGGANDTRERDDARIFERFMATGELTAEVVAAYNRSPSVFAELRQRNSDFHAWLMQQIRQSNR